MRDRAAETASMTLNEEDQEVVWRLAAAILARQGGSVEAAVGEAARGYAAFQHHLHSREGFPAAGGATIRGKGSKWEIELPLPAKPG